MSPNEEPALRVEWGLLEVGELSEECITGCDRAGQQLYSRTAQCCRTGK